MTEVDTPAPLYQRLASRLQAFPCRDQRPRRVFATLPAPSQERLKASLSDTPVDADTLAAPHSPLWDQKHETVLYLAYGSNLCNETFRGARGIRPLSQINVLVPSLRLTFDLPGIPYSEPCFANTARRNPDAHDSKGGVEESDYHKTRWYKGLVGVVYEVTRSDYAHIIATEGGGSAYNDILVDCYALPTSDTIPSSPTSPPFKAHTLFAPVVDEAGKQATGRVTRPDPNYAQPSARYLKLITDGAAECHLPTEYQDYLRNIRPYSITSKRQVVGKALFLATWLPFVMLIFALAKSVQDKRGRAPWWFARFSALIFASMWISYDGAYKRLFGDGERTIRSGSVWEGNRKDSDVRLHQEYTEKEHLLEGGIQAMHSISLEESSSLHRWSNVV